MAAQRPGRARQHPLRGRRALVYQRPDREVIYTIISGVLRAPDLGLGLRVQDVRMQEAPAFAAGKQLFRMASPVFIKHEVEKGKPADHLLPGHALADELLTATLRYKLRQAGLDDAGAAVCFDPAYISSAKSKLFRYKQVQCRGSVCPVLVSGSAEQIGFAWEVGVGHSTGIGCGALV